MTLYAMATSMPPPHFGRPTPEHPCAHCNGSGEARQFVIFTRDHVKLTVWEHGDGWQSERAYGSTTLGGYWRDLGDLAGMLRTSRPHFIAKCLETFGVEVVAHERPAETAWTYDSEQAIPERILHPSQHRCTHGGRHVVSWDAAMDLGRHNAGGVLACLDCGRDLTILPDPTREQREFHP